MADIRVNTQSSIRLTGSKTLYFDPWKLDSDAPKADVVFVTHSHFDHFSPEDIARIASGETVVVVPEKMADDVLSKTGVPAERLLAVVPGQSYTVNGVSFETVPAYNRLKPFHPKRDGWCGYIAGLDGQRYYVMGDTDETPESLNVKCDVLLLPIGGTYTMDCRQAAEYACKVMPKTAVPTHYGEVVGKPSDGESFKKLVNAKAPEINVEIKL